MSCDWRGVIEALDAAAQLAGEDFLVGPDRQRADVAGQVIALVPGLPPGQRGGFGAQVHRCAVGSGGGWGGAAAGAAAGAAGRGGGRRPLSALPRQVRADRVRLRADAGYFAGELARVASLEGVEARSAPNASRRYGGCWNGMAATGWSDAIEMPGAQIAIADYRPDWWPQPPPC